MRQTILLRSEGVIAGQCPASKATRCAHSSIDIRLVALGGARDSPTIRWVLNLERFSGSRSDPLAIDQQFLGGRQELCNGTRYLGLFDYSAHLGSPGDELH